MYNISSLEKSACIIFQACIILLGEIQIPGKIPSGKFGKFSRDFFEKKISAKIFHSEPRIGMSMSPII
jgi:hypothetical protein